MDRLFEAIKDRKECMFIVVNHRMMISVRIENGIPDYNGIPAAQIVMRNLNGVLFCILYTYPHRGTIALDPALWLPLHAPVYCTLFVNNDRMARTHGYLFKLFLEEEFIPMNDYILNSDDD